MKHKCILATFLLTACADKSAPEDTDTENGNAYEIMGDGWGCSGKKSTWSEAAFDIWTSPDGAPATEVELFRLTDEWTEAHALSLATDTGAEGYDYWLVEGLQIVAETTEYESGISTLFPCDEQELAEWAARFSVFDHDGSLAHCSLRGDDTSAFENDGCESNPWS